MTVRIIDGVPHEEVRWTDSCSGCFEGVEEALRGFYAIDPKAGCYVGSGCAECGYTGKRRRVELVPLETQ